MSDSYPPQPGQFPEPEQPSQHPLPPGYSPPGYPPQPGYPFRQGYPQQPGYPRPGAGFDDPTNVIGPRCGQYALDTLIPFLPVWILSTAVNMLILSSAFNPQADWKAPVGGLIGAAVLVGLLGIAGGFLLMVWWPNRHGGQTFAMQWLKLKIIDGHGGVPTIGALTIRWLPLLVEFLFWFFKPLFGIVVLMVSNVVGIIVMATSPRHQRVGDMLAKTLVVRAG